MSIEDELRALERRWSDADLGQVANGEFRATQIAVHDGSGWRLAELHLSPIAVPPPFAKPVADQEGGAR
jgi:hypothetical protein